MDLRAPGFHAAGVSLPGVPMIVGGHNEHIAWGYTALYGDTQDLYVERTNGQGEYWDGTGWRPMERDHETIQVRFGKNQEFDVLRTNHGPVITSLVPHESRTIALRWTVYDPQFASGMPLYGAEHRRQLAAVRSRHEPVVGAHSERRLCRRPGTHRLPGHRPHSATPRRPGRRAHRR